MKSMVVMTYYQLMHAIVLASEFEEKPDLFFSQGYLGVEEEFLDRIRASGVFHSVTGITARGDVDAFTGELRRTEEMTDAEIAALGSSLFDRWLEPMYAEKFSHADFHDSIYVYNDFQYHYYYIAKHFDSIIGVEDGYKSLLQQTKIHRYKGAHQLVRRFIRQGSYPEPLYRHPKVGMIISSADFEELDEYYRVKLCVWDFQKAAARHQEELAAALLTIFDVGDLEIRGPSALYLGQPLARARYCTSIEEHLLQRRYLHSLCREGFEVYYKPHPAEDTDPRLYENDHIHILEGNFPVEVLNYLGVSFSRVVSYGSTGVDTITCAEEHIKLNRDELSSIDVIARHIENRIAGEKLVFNIYVKVSELTTDAFVNVYSGLINHRHAVSRVHVLVPEQLAGQAERFFTAENIPRQVRRYRAAHRSYKDRVLWQRELDALRETARSSGSRVRVCPVKSLAAWDVFRRQMTDDGDFYLLLEEHNNMFGLFRQVFRDLDRRMQLGLIYRNCVLKTRTASRSPLQAVNPGHVSGYLSGQLVNRIWHRRVIEAARAAGVGSEEEFERVVNRYAGGVGCKYTAMLLLPEEDYLSIADGEAHYGARLRDILAQQEEGAADETARRAALVLRDYYDWLHITRSRSSEEQFHRLAEHCGLPDALRAQALCDLSFSLMAALESENKRQVNQDYEFLRYIHHLTRVMARRGILRRSQQAAAAVGRIKGRMEDVKTRITGRKRRSKTAGGSRNV